MELKLPGGQSAKDQSKTSDIKTVSFGVSRVSSDSSIETNTPKANDSVELTLTKESEENKIEQSGISSAPMLSIA